MSLIEGVTRALDFARHVIVGTEVIRSEHVAPEVYEALIERGRIRLLDCEPERPATEEERLTIEALILLNAHELHDAARLHRETWGES